METAKNRLLLSFGLSAAWAVNTACMPILTEYNLCDKMNAWGKETPYLKDSKSWKTPFYELNGVYYVETVYGYMEESLPIRIVHGKASSQWPKGKSRDLYTEVYYCVLTPQQVKDYLGEDAAELPDGTPMILHERDFDRESAGGSPSLPSSIHYDSALSCVEHSGHASISACLIWNKSRK